MGSSPLSRGIPLMLWISWQPQRIIPALAGNTEPGSGRHPHKGDHPRSRGEYPSHRGVSRAGRGSSPLSRGIQSRLRGFLDPVRIIPALAGNTRFGSPSYYCSSDHPRSRGEYGRRTLVWRSTAGSSPLSRGIPALMQNPLSVYRIIPALAGNTRTTPRPR